MALKTIAAAELKRIVVFKKPTFSRNAQGGKEATYTDTDTAKAKIEPTNYRLQEIAPALLNTDTVYVRYSGDRKLVTKDWLMAYDGIDHVIHSIELIGAERNDFIKLVVRAKSG